ncbi:hypothetical protein EDB19DRAFT_646256 [Suillus lakei]|nr:hypothetical protein EDB19DRAFT_646256 [Suillus lakei]
MLCVTKDSFLVWRSLLYIRCLWSVDILIILLFFFFRSVVVAHIQLGSRRLGLLTDHHFKFHCWIHTTIPPPCKRSAFAIPWLNSYL